MACIASHSEKKTFSRRYEPVRWVEQSFEATPSTAPSRFVAARHSCRTAGGASYFALLGASYRPGGGRSLRGRLGGGDHVVGGLPAEVAALVLVGEAVEAWPERPGADRLGEA